MTLNPYSDPSGTGLAKPLPENLRAFFRPICMVKADVQIIAEAYLASSGFQSAYFLSKKLVNAMHFASNELTRHNHYDFGMRTIKAVIHTAIKLLEDSPASESFSQPPFSDRESSSPDSPSTGGPDHQSPETREAAIMCRALREMNIPRFIPSDAIKFE